jgi:proton-coupled amino acid transporter
MCIDLIFIATNAHTYFSVSKEAVVLACLPFLIVLSLLKHIKELAWVALAADTMNFFGLAIVYMTDFSLIDLSSARTSELNWLGTLSSIPFFFGIATYCFSGIGMILPLEKAMENKAHFPRILMLTVALIGSIYASFGISGYLAFGESTEDVVTLNIQGHGGLATTVKLFLCAGLFFAYPMMLFPVFEVLQPAILKNVSTEQNPEVRKKTMLKCTAVPG